MSRTAMSVEALNSKRARLRHELQQAHDAWILAPSSDVANIQWSEYLAAKDRLVLAYAEQPLTA